MSVANAINNIKNSKNPISDSVMYSATSYLGQAVPTIGGKFNNVIDDTRRKSYIDQSEGTFVSKYFTATEQQFLNQIIKKIPFASKYLEPKVDIWGEEEKSGSLPLRIFQNFISPGYVSEIELDETEKMIDSLYKESGESKILPVPANKSFTLNKEKIKLNAEEYTKFAKARGQMAHGILSELSMNENFYSMDTANKTLIIGMVYDFSNAIAKMGVSDYEPDGWEASTIAAGKTGMKYSDFLMMYNDIKAIKEIGGDGTKERVKSAISKLSIPSLQKDALWKAFYDEKSLGGESFSW